MKILRRHTEFLGTRGAMTKLQEILARNIKRARIRLGFSQMKLAELCGLSTSFLGEIELGKKFPSPPNLERIAASLGLKPYQLFFEDEQWEIYDKYERITSLYQDLKEKINHDLEDTVRKYLQS
jgi:transcriptional regulator with XRE-family HTH domain